MKDAMSVVGATVLAFVVLAGLWIAGGFIGLWWYPYSIQRQTAIVRQSNSYVTTKQQELVTMLVGYNTAGTDAQKRAIMVQMCQDAALIPGYVPPAVSQTNNGECGQ
jgi:hypothetical protein